MSSNTTTNTTSDSTDDTAVMHHYTDLFNKDPTLASHFLECLEHLSKSQQVDGFDLEKAWNLFDSTSLDDRKKHVKSQLQKAKRDAVPTTKNFVPVGVTKPPVPREMFRTQFKLSQAEAGKEYKEAEFKEAWENVSVKDREALEAKRDELLAAYNEERTRQVDEQVALGNLTEPKPKNVPNAFFLYKERALNNPSKYLSAAEVKKFKTMVSIDQTKFLSTKYQVMKDKKDTVYSDLMAEIADMEPLHTAEMYEWRVRTAKRHLAKAERLEDSTEVDKCKTVLLNLENNRPTDYNATSKNATDVASPESFAKVENKPATTSKGKGKGKGKAK